MPPPPCAPSGPVVLGRGSRSPASCSLAPWSIPGSTLGGEGHKRGARNKRGPPPAPAQGSPLGGGAARLWEASRPGAGPARACDCGSGRLGDLPLGSGNRAGASWWPGHGEGPPRKRRPRLTTPASFREDDVPEAALP